MRVLVANNFRVYPLFPQQAAKVCQCYRHCFVPAVRLSCGLRECSSSAAVGHLKTNAVSGGQTESFPYSKSLQSLRVKPSRSHKHQKTSRLSPISQFKSLPHPPLLKNTVSKSQKPHAQNPRMAPRLFAARLSLCLVFLFHYLFHCMVEEGDRVVILGLRAPWNLMLSEELKKFLFWFSSDLAGCNTVDKENFGPIHGLGVNDRPLPERYIVIQHYISPLALLVVLQPTLYDKGCARGGMYPDPVCLVIP